ncbi:hypothetical protein KGA66_11255 [Actinocrinis puniceicyclus]|uniref:Uncharacterized protein n=1 Tax=Actinocrinis puniceicyclus TaxID=977794 RepID=A0A8J7WJV9_9ACTN|nr:hypothetical protein [Actinocrinis puniceicyclus]MBS2963628.1 hypothetical protein [Actinocrinis puniceicyclus]
MPRTAQTRDDSEALARRGGGGGWLKALIIATVIAALLAAAALWAVHKLGHLSIFHTSGCTASSPAGSMSLDLEQAKNAATITAVGVSMNVPDFGIQVALATARQESKLHDLDYGDRDSVGLFQQRPSQGWGTRTQILDPVYAATKFYQALLNVPDWQKLPLTEAAQAVQKSGAPSAYAQYEQFATVLTAVFTGSAGAGLGCTLDGPTFPPQSKAGAALLTSRGQVLVDQLRTQFGSANVGRVSGIPANGLSFDVAAPGSLSGTAATARTWAYANWAAAQAETTGIAQLSYGGKTWSASDGSAGWKADSGAVANAAALHIVMVSGG